MKSVDTYYRNLAAISGPATLREAIQSRTDDELTEAISEIVTSVPNRVGMTLAMYRYERDALAEAWSLLLNNSPPAEVLEMLMECFDGNSFVEYYKREWMQ